MSKLKNPLRGRVGSPDRAQRLTIGLTLLALNVMSLSRGDGDLMRWIALLVQIDLIGTAVIGWCPLYWSFSTHSCPIRASRPKPVENHDAD